MPLEPGLAASFRYAVTDADTAVALGSGDVAVLGTPKVVALVEQASCAAVLEHIPPDMTTVGTRVIMDHVVPTPVGVSVRVEAVLESVEGRRLTFGVHVSDDERTVASGQVHRTLVTREKFERAAQRSSE